MNLYGYEFQRESDLTHYGILGMHWGVRRYQNADGTLTNAGKKRYDKESKGSNKEKNKETLGSKIAKTFESKKNPGYSVFEDWYGKDEADRVVNAWVNLESYRDKYGDANIDRIYNYAMNRTNHENYETGNMLRVLQKVPESKLEEVKLFGDHSLVRAPRREMQAAAREMLRSGDLTNYEYEKVLTQIDEEYELYKKIKLDSVYLEAAANAEDTLIKDVEKAEIDFSKTPKGVLNTSISAAKNLFKKGIDFVSSLFSKKKK